MSETEAIIDKTIEIVCKCRGVGRDELFGENRSQRVCIAQYMILSYLHNNVKLSSFFLERHFPRTRRQILHGIKMLKNHISVYPALLGEYMAIVREIEEATEAAPSEDMK